MINPSKKALLFVLFLAFQIPAMAQTNVDSLKYEILNIQADIENIHLNLEKSKSKFQRGILLATISYSVTIAGGLMLGRENDKTGQALLIAGGIGGITGTYMLVDAFKYLGRTRRATLK